MNLVAKQVVAAKSLIQSWFLRSNIKKLFKLQCVE